MKFAVRLNQILMLMCLVVAPAWLAGCGAYGGGGNGGGGGASAPAAPIGLAAAAANAQVNLTWNASTGATGYYVKRSTTSGAEAQIAAVSATSYPDNNVANGTKYYYVVSAYNSYGPSANSAEVNATPVAPPPPSAPTGLVATAGNAQVMLTWNASTSAASYNVKRTTTSGTGYQTVGSPTTTSFTDPGLTNGTTYYYVVTAVDSAGESGPSSQVSATPAAPAQPPPAPTALTATAGNAQVNLTWNPSSGATSYHVKRSTTNGSGYAQVGAPTTTSFNDPGLTNGTTYYYVVTALNSAGESANSNQASATPANAVADVTITIDPTKTKPISPYIYGTNFYSGNTSPQPNFTFDRDGGNRWTAYNWINNGSNAGSDYFYENDNYLCNGSCNASIPAEAVRTFIAADHSAGLASLVTFQMQGYVSVDTTNIQVPMPFPNLTYFRPVVSKKSSASNAPFTLTPPAASTDKNVYMDEFAWALDQKFLSQNVFSTGAAQPTFISLDNEPDLWYSTHEEIQGSTIVNGQKANNLSAASFITKTVSLSTALKDLNKNAQSPFGHFSNVVIFGPVNYGFNGIYGWQGDPTLSPTPNGADWFADKYMAGIKAASTTYGAPLVDVYDFHWYSEATDGTTRVTSMTGSSLTDAQVQAIVQSPRSLWDTTFKEDSWITNNVLGGPIYILGRLQTKIATENPGMKISISEYENGGFNHIAGTIAQADNLGIFGSEGIFAANFWPPNGTYSYTLAGFRAYRGFDGAGSNFGDTSLQSTSSAVQNVVVYASTDSTAPGRVVFVAINRSSTAKVTAINGQALSGTAHLYQMTGPFASPQTVVQPVSIGTMTVSGSSLTITLPAYSVTTIDVQ
jgi:fibronectin type 3 domain-containing protein